MPNPTHRIRGPRPSGVSCPTMKFTAEPLRPMRCGARSTVTPRTATMGLGLPCPNGARRSSRSTTGRFNADSVVSASIRSMGVSNSGLRCSAA